MVNHRIVLQASIYFAIFGQNLWISIDFTVTHIVVVASDDVCCRRRCHDVAMVVVVVAVVVVVVTVAVAVDVVVAVLVTVVVNVVVVTLSPMFCRHHFVSFCRVVSSSLCRRHCGARAFVAVSVYASSVDIGVVGQWLCCCYPPTGMVLCSAIRR